MVSSLLGKDSDGSEAPGTHVMHQGRRDEGPGATWMNTDIKSTDSFTLERPPTFPDMVAPLPPLWTDNLLPGSKPQDSVGGATRGWKAGTSLMFHSFIHSTVTTKTDSLFAPETCRLLNDSLATAPREDPGSVMARHRQMGPRHRFRKSRNKFPARDTFWKL